MTPPSFCWSSSTMCSVKQFSWGFILKFSAGQQPSLDCIHTRVEVFIVGPLTFNPHTHRWCIWCIELMNWLQMNKASSCCSTNDGAEFWSRDLFPLASLSFAFHEWSAKTELSRSFLLRLGSTGPAHCLCCTDPALCLGSSHSLDCLGCLIVFSAFLMAAEWIHVGPFCLSIDF